MTGFSVHLLLCSSRTLLPVQLRCIHFCRCWQSLRHGYKLLVDFITSETRYIPCSESPKATRSFTGHAHVRDGSESRIPGHF